MFDFLHDEISISLLLLVGVACFLGGRMVQEYPPLAAWGRRIAVAAFLIFAADLWHSWSPSTPEEVLGIVFRSLIGACLVLGVAWAALPVLAFLYAHTIGAALDKITHWWWRWSRWREECRARRRAERARRRAAWEWEAGAPERERQQREAEARARAEQAARKRRQDARAGIELVYALYKPEIGERFPQEAFDAFLAKYMGDEHAADYVEQRARQLHDIILQHREKSAPTPKFKSLSDLTRWFEAQRDEIEQVPDERMRKRMLVQLKERYSDLTSQLLEEI